VAWHHCIRPVYRLSQWEWRNFGSALKIASAKRKGGHSAPCEGVGLQWVRVPPGNWVAPAGSSRSGGGGNEAVGAFDVKGRSRRSREQTGRNESEHPTRPRKLNRGRRPIYVLGKADVAGDQETGWNTPAQERSDPASPPGYRRRHVGTGDLTQHGKPLATAARDRQPDAREGQAGPREVRVKIVGWITGREPVPFFLHRGYRRTMRDRHG
jgi:hypothetical protein